MDALNELIKTGAEKVINKSNCLFSVPCIIVSALGNQMYRVKLVTSDAQYNVMNYSGADLQVGESAQLYYRNNIISEQTAYIGSALTKASGHVGGLQFIKLTQAEYDAIVNKDNNTVYYVVNNSIVTQYLGSTPVGISADFVDDTSTTHKFATVAQLSQIQTNADDISTLQQTIGDINAVLEEVL